MQLYVIMYRVVIQFGVYFAAAHISCRHAGICQRLLERCITADGHLRRAGFHHVLQLLDRECGQLVKLECTALRQHAVHQRGLAGRDVVFTGLLFQRIVFFDRLAEHCGFRGLFVQDTVHCGGQLTLQLGSTIGIAVLDRDNALRGEHSGMSHTAANVLAPHTAVEGNA